MDVNVYAVSKLAEARLNDLRAERARIALLESLRGPRRPLAERLGAALIRAGRWLSGDAASPVARPDGRHRHLRHSARAA